MNILILDNDEMIWQGVEYFKEIENDWEFFSYSSFKKNNFSFEDMDLVVVDISDKKYLSTYYEILKLDENKRIIIISESLESCNNNNCLHCSEYCQIRRLMKPIEYHKLYRLINSFEVKCDFYNAFENITNLFESVIKRYSTLLYNSDTKEVFINIKSPANLYTQELLAFVNILEQNSVSYTIIDETKIKIN